MLLKGNITMPLLFTYISSQVLGAFVGACAVYFTYKNHYDETDNTGLILATFCTSPAKRSTVQNLFSEIIGTFVLIFAILNIPEATNDLGGLNPLPVALIVLSIGLSLGGTTGYAINPARDFGPRLAHSFLPIKRKGSSEWSYAWIPIVGPIVGAIVAVLLYSNL
jgi:glycerol uptake facilitator protein